MLIYIYTKHIYIFLGNICTHLLFVFWRQTNFSLISLGLYLCKTDISMVQVSTSTKEKCTIIFDVNIPSREYRSRNSRQRCSVKKSVLENVKKFKVNDICQSLFFIKVAGEKAPAQMFSCKFCAKLLRAPCYRTPPCDYLCRSWCEVERNVLTLFNKFAI